MSAPVFCKGGFDYRFEDELECVVIEFGKDGPAVMVTRDKFIEFCTTLRPAIEAMFERPKPRVAEILPFRKEGPACRA